jgi:hypothetical protein
MATALQTPTRIPYSLVPWEKLIRWGKPEFVVTRLALFWEGQTYEPGSPLPQSLSNNRIRMRQFYEQRRIAPVIEAPPEPEPEHPKRKKK